MNNPSDRSPSKAAPRKTRRSAELISTEELEALRDVRLCQCGLAGDVAAMIEWLPLFGGPAWRLPPDMQPPDHYRHDQGREQS